MEPDSTFAEEVPEIGECSLAVVASTTLDPRTAAAAACSARVAVASCTELGIPGTSQCQSDDEE